MTELPTHQPLSRIELIVLARLSDSQSPTEADIAKSLSQSGIPLKGPALTDCVTATLAALQSRLLVAPGAAPPSRRRKSTTARSSRKRSPSSEPRTPRFALTDSGRLALRNALALEATPSWKDTYNSIVPALALGLHPGSKMANAVLRSTEAMTTRLLRRDPALGEPLTVNQLCDQVIARAIGMPPGPVTPASIRAYALAMHCGVDGKAEITRIAASFAPTSAGKTGKKAEKEVKMLATRFAAEQLHTQIKNRPAMVRALRERWLSHQDEADGAHRRPALWSTPPRPSETPELTDPPATASSHLPPLHAVAADTLLTAVREAIPMIGSDGRYGKENVFVSALWQHLSRDRRLPDLSLDRFKRWLVAANRDQLVDLARADLVDAMDARLVEESEIEDLGSTFHFVVDRREMPAEPGQIAYAR